MFHCILLFFPSTVKLSVTSSILSGSSSATLNFITFPPIFHSTRYTLYYPLDSRHLFASLTEEYRLKSGELKFKS